MGVPVVTCAGRVHASRVGVSLLSAIGLDDLVAPSMESYVQTAIGLAQDVVRLRSLRAELRPRMAGGAIMDRARIAREVEAAYRSMWRRHCERGV
jgi:predicted O-linked N-acetylglucosamine transferase (SPINDLY family)